MINTKLSDASSSLPHAARMKFLFALSATVALHGCGGGGDSTSTTAPATAPTAPTAPTATATNADLVTTVTPPTYAAGTTERGAWTVLMAERGACGFGLLQQDTRLDAASAAHASYLVNQSAAMGRPVIGHGETSGTTGFTGTDGFARAVAQGFPSTNSSVTEIIGARYGFRTAGQAPSYTSSEAVGAASMRQLLGSVYHLSGGMNSGRLGGVGSADLVFSTTGGAFEEDYRFGALIGTTDTHPQRLGTGALATYPCASATQVTSTFKPTDESPSAFPDVTDTNTVYGTPVYLKADAQSVLTVTSATIARSDGTVVTSRQVTAATDTSGELGANEFFIVPTTALLVGTAYSVQVVGTVDGTPFASHSRSPRLTDAAVFIPIFGTHRLTRSRDLLHIQAMQFDPALAHCRALTPSSRGSMCLTRVAALQVEGSSSFRASTDFSTSNELASRAASPTPLPRTTSIRSATKDRDHHH